MTLKPIHPNEPVTEDGKKPSRVLIEIIQRIIAEVNGLSLSGGGGVWGAITGTIGSQTDLQTALNGKSDTGHTHVAANVTDLAATVQAYTLDQFANPATSVDFAQQQALQFVIENRTSDPGSPVAGQLWLRTDL